MIDHSRDEHDSQEAVEQVFDDAIALPESERLAFVDASGLDDTARRKVIDLLRFYVAEPTPPLSRAKGDHSTEERLVGSRIGGCTVQRLIGVGGMGAVYEAMQDEPRRRVALKVLRASLAGGSAERRFRLEAALMSRLEHPGIARVYASGTGSAIGSGRDLAEPWIAMEFVEDARAITSYCRDAQLSPREIVRLFIEVADAVAFGHARGVLHRDLKPANILVDGHGRPRVIDFGIAKAIDGDRVSTLAITVTTRLVGTLQYMSPEQFGTRDAADTRSDPLLSAGRFLAIRPQGDRIAMVSNDRRLAMVDATSGERLLRMPLPATVGDLRFSEDGKQLVIGCTNGRILIFGEMRQQSR